MLFKFQLFIYDTWLYKESLNQGSVQQKKGLHIFICQYTPLLMFVSLLLEQSLLVIFLIHHMTTISDSIYYEQHRNSFPSIHVRN